MSRNATSFACLPMYWFEPNAQAHQSLWRAVADELVALGLRNVPAALTPPFDRHEAMWQPGLLLGQTCGYPLMMSLKDQRDANSAFDVIATPVYDTPYSCGAWCRSVVLVHDTTHAIDDVRGGRCAFNEPDSQSGYNALRHFLAIHFGPGQHFGKVVRTGTHFASMSAIQQRKADICAVDCVTYSLLRDLHPQLFTSVKVLATTQAYPGLPLVSDSGLSNTNNGRGDLPRVLRLALTRALRHDAIGAVCRQLRWHAIEHLPVNAYQRILTMEQEALDLRYPIIA